jgi:cytidylate kinase
LPYAEAAPFNSFAKQNDPICLPDTRVNLLHDIYNWADGRDERGIFWLNGMAGTGKSTISRTVARRYFDQKRLGASFFFSRGGGDVGNAKKFVTSIAFQLASSIPSLDEHICDALKKRRDVIGQSLRDQWQQLVLYPLSKLDGNGCEYSYVLIIDALDECDDDSNIRTILHLAAGIRQSEKVRLRIFLTSRSEIPVRHGFHQLSDVEHQEFILHNISPSIVNQDIRTFLENAFQVIAQERSIVAGWPGQQIITRLVQNASGLFIWAAIAYRFIREGKRLAAKRLDMILEHSSTTINAPEKHLNEIYITVLRHCISPEHSDEEAEELRSILKSLLGGIITLLSPLSTQSLSKLLSTPQDEVDQTLDDLHAILNIPKDPTHPLRLHHPSFRDFLYKKTRCEEFWVDEKQAHQVLADRCLQLMSTSLRQDICGVDAPGMLVADIESSRVEQSLSPEVQYACRYWTEHVRKGGGHLRDNGQVYQFLQEHLLHWLEALGWMKQISEGVLAISSLEAQLLVSLLYYLRES